VTQTRKRSAHAAGFSAPRAVVYVTRSPFVSGAERCLVRLAAALDAARYDAFVIAGARGEFPALLSDAGIAHRRISLPPPQRLWPFPFLRAVARMAFELRRRRAALVHVNDAPAAVHAAIAARMLGIPRICHVRFTYGAEGLRWYLKYGFERAVFPSQFLREYAQSKCPDVFPDGRCTVIHDGFDPPPPPSAAHLIRLSTALGLAPTDRVLGFVGQVIAVKGVREYLHMAVRVLRTDARCRFLIVGDDLQAGPSYRRQMEELAAALGIAEACRFTGFRDDVWEILHLCDVVVLPSHVEPFGTLALEASAAARALVATRVGGLVEIVQDGETGLLAAAADAEALARAAEQLLSNPELCRTLGTRARRRVLEHFSLHSHVQKLADLYDDVLARQAGVPPLHIE
jgi:L-malate glycosyltransferase